VVKHTNPCGAAAAATIAEALAAAWEGDPLSAFGSVLALTRPLDRAAAEFLCDGNRFVECIAAPGFEPAALELVTTKPKWGRNLRLVACGPIGPAARDSGLHEVKPIAGGFLVQSRDLAVEEDAALEVPTRAKPTAEQLRALRFAARVCKHVKSNAIVLARGTVVVGVGAGQMSRVDSVHLAARKAGPRSAGSVLASDAFFPFPDGVEAAMEAGVCAILQPGGSVKDAEVVRACDARNVSMAMSGLRHFRH
jgi:phosphoribosylaminoimidazolecarboxamide formyltransferase/IMP cyclohydrolase